MAKRTKPCEICGVQEGAAIFASDPTCSDTCAKALKARQEAAEGAYETFERADSSWGGSGYVENPGTAWGIRDSNAQIYPYPTHTPSVTEEQGHSHEPQVGDVMLGDQVFAREPQTWDERDAEEVASHVHEGDTVHEHGEEESPEERAIGGLCVAVQDLQHCRTIFERCGIDTEAVDHEITTLGTLLMELGHVHEEDVVPHEPHPHDHVHAAHDNADSVSNL